MLYSDDTVCGMFEIDGEQTRTLYARSVPGSIGEAENALDEALKSFSQSQTINDINDVLGQKVGSTFRIRKNGNYTIKPPTNTENGKITGTVRLYDTYNITSKDIDYNNTLFKAKIQNTGKETTVKGLSDTACTLYAAEYENGILKSLTPYDVSIKEGETLTVDTDNKKVFLWDFNRLYPYAASLK